MLFPCAFLNTLNSLVTISDFKMWSQYIDYFNRDYIKRLSLYNKTQRIKEISLFVSWIKRYWWSSTLFIINCEWIRIVKKTERKNLLKIFDGLVGIFFFWISNWQGQIYLSLQNIFKIVESIFILMFVLLQLFFHKNS